MTIFAPLCTSTPVLSGVRSSSDRAPRRRSTAAGRGAPASPAPDGRAAGRGRRSTSSPCLRSRVRAVRLRPASRRRPRTGSRGGRCRCAAGLISARGDERVLLELRIEHEAVVVVDRAVRRVRRVWLVGARTSVVPGPLSPAPVDGFEWRSAGLPAGAPAAAHAARVASSALVSRRTSRPTIARRVVARHPGRHQRRPASFARSRSRALWRPRRSSARTARCRRGDGSSCTSRRGSARRRRCRSGRGGGPP